MSLRKYIDIVESATSRLVEAKVFDLPVGGVEIRIWQNPTAAELRNLLKRMPEMRGISTPSSVYI